ncbi:MAG: phosphatidylglycerophosphatase A [Deltaproteobacteria bacterium]|nr:phosphatidylglycerophosphatase A [Deltaproteobacteria bacterium]
MMDRLVVWFATGCGAGFVPRIPGTVGTALGMPLAAGMAALPPGPLAACVVTFGVVAMWIADRALCRFPVKDPRQIVIDEVAGYLVAVAGHPWSWRMALVAFVCFRLFDVVKPPPCRRLERLPGGVGIVADDLAAGVYTNGLVWLLAAVLPL